MIAQRNAHEKQSRRRLVVDRVDDLVETFIREHVDKIGTSRRITNLLRRDVIPYWGAKSIHEIKKRDVSDLISLIAQRNAHASHRLLKTLKTRFRWCVGRAVIDFSPAEDAREQATLVVQATNNFHDWKFTIARYLRTGKSKLCPLNVMSWGRS
jgi:hypothetical protein